MVHTQAEAKQLFVDKVTQRAQIERVELSDDERQMLLWSESRDSVLDFALAERLALQSSDADYEVKIAGLLHRSFREEVAADPQAKEVWRQAWSVLKLGDDYILIMVGQAVGRELKQWWQFW